MPYYDFSFRHHLVGLMAIFPFIVITIASSLGNSRVVTMHQLIAWAEGADRREYWACWRSKAWMTRMTWKSWAFFVSVIESQRIWVTKFIEHKRPIQTLTIGILSYGSQVMYYTSSVASQYRRWASSYCGDRNLSGGEIYEGKGVFYLDPIRLFIP